MIGHNQIQIKYGLNIKHTLNFLINKMFRYCNILLHKLQQYNMVCLLFTMFVFFSIIMNVEGEEGNKENLFAGENQTKYTFSFRYATFLGQFCDLVVPLVFILRTSMKETNLSGDI